MSETVKTTRRKHNVVIFLTLVGIMISWVKSLKYRGKEVNGIIINQKYLCAAMNNHQNKEKNSETRRKYLDIKTWMER